MCTRVSCTSGWITPGTTQYDHKYSQLVPIPFSCLVVVPGIIFSSLLVLILDTSHSEYAGSMGIVGTDAEQANGVRFSELRSFCKKHHGED